MEFEIYNRNIGVLLFLRPYLLENGGNIEDGIIHNIVSIIINQYIINLFSSPMLGNLIFIVLCCLFAGR